MSLRGCNSRGIMNNQLFFFNQANLSCVCPMGICVCQNKLYFFCHNSKLPFPSNMAFRFRRRRFRRRRRWRSRRYRPRRRYWRASRRRRAARLYRIYSPFPTYQPARLKYSTWNTLTPGVGGITVASFWRLNSVYDPYQTGTGGQPRGFDEYAALYYNYCVTSVKWWITFHSTQTVAYPFVARAVGWHYGGLTSVPTNGYQDYREMRHGQQGYLTGAELFALKMKGSLSMRKYFRAPALTTSERFVTEVSTNPTDQVFLAIYAASTINGQDCDPVQCEIKLEYNVIFSDPKSMNPS